jgi:mRNA-degrading endonuclease toxin of MazEF toxin-antitoxin module
MEEIVAGDVWFVDFPYEEDPKKSSTRPVIVVSVSDDKLKVLSVKVTKHDIRKEDRFDTKIFYWEAAYLRFPSTARISKIRTILSSDFKFRIGKLHPADWENVTNKVQKFFNEQNDINKPQS